MAILSGVLSDVDNPKTIKTTSKTQLAFKEVRDTLFKFLMIAGIPFEGRKKLQIPVDWLPPSLKGKKQKRVVEFFGLNIEVEEEYDPITLYRQAYYTVTCELKGITINRESVYLVAIPGNFRDLDKRNKTKIQILSNHYNVIWFDEADYVKIGLDISDKKWLAPMSKSQLTRCAKLLFKKILGLKGNLESSYTLNDVLNNINVSMCSKSNGAVNHLLSENSRLKTALRTTLLKSGGCKVTIKNEPAVKLLANMNQDSLEWLESILSTVESKITAKLVRDISCKFLPSSGDKLVGCITSKLSITNVSGMNLELVDNGMLLIKDKHTLQEVVIKLTASDSGARRPSIKVRNSVLKSNSLVFNIHLVLKRNSKFYLETKEYYAIPVSADLTLDRACALELRKGYKGIDLKSNL